MGRDINRRDLLKVAAVASAGAALAGPLSRIAGAAEGAPAAAPASDGNKELPSGRRDPAETVSLVQGDPVLALRKSIQLLGGIEQFVKKDSTVLIKPNIGFPTAPEIGATVSPAVVAELARLCVEAGASKVIINDHPCRRPEVCLKITGIEEACRKVPKTYVFATVDGAQFEDLDVPKGVALKRTAILRDFKKAQTVINIATAKSHSSAGVSFCLKNLMGLILAREPFHKEFDLHQAIADLATAIRCDLNIVDASRALVTGGPAGPGDVVHPKAIVAGRNVVAVDSVALTLAKWYGREFKPKDVKHIAYAERHGLGPAEMDRIKVLRETV